jgi:hypothetical protein
MTIGHSGFRPIRTSIVIRASGFDIPKRTNPGKARGHKYQNAGTPGKKRRVCMESLLKPVTLTQDVVRVLDEIRAGANNALYCAKPDVSEELFAKHIVSLVEGAGLPVLQTMHYRWFLRELARLWRTRTGRDLAFHLELCIRKWVGLGLEPRTLQFLVTEAHERLKGQTKSEVRNQNAEGRSADADPTTKTPRHEENQDSSRITGPQPQADICVHLRSSAVDSPSPASAESVDDIPDSTAKIAKGPDTGTLEPSTPGTLS